MQWVDIYGLCQAQKILCRWGSTDPLTSRGWGCSLYPWIHESVEEWNPCKYRSQPICSYHWWKGELWLKESGLWPLTEWMASFNPGTLWSHIWFICTFSFLQWEERSAQTYWSKPLTIWKAETSRPQQDTLIQAKNKFTAFMLLYWVCQKARNSKSA